jgi:hypothetical protein
LDFLRFIRVAPAGSLVRVGLCVVVALADVDLEVGHDRAAHRAGDRAAVGAARGPEAARVFTATASPSTAASTAAGSTAAASTAARVLAL